MPNRGVQEWIRMSQRTPGILIFGMVMAPCGWVLDLTSTVAPNWRTLHGVTNQPTDFIVQQGIFDICSTTTSSTRNDCTLSDTQYFANQIIEIAQGMMVASLVVTLVGIAVAIPGVRCWKNTGPNWTVAGLGGLLIFCSGVLTIIPIAWYTHILNDLNTTTTATEVRVGFCIVLGYIGGIFEVLGGLVMFIGICRCCKGRNRGEIRADRAVARFNHQKDPPRRLDVPSLSRPRSTASSVPYSNKSIDDDVSFPRAKSPARSVNAPEKGRPYDADL